MNKPLILVVEDDSSVKNLITTTLKAHDYRHLTAPNGKATILEASSHNPDIVLLDLGLPDIDGVDVIKKIRTWSNMPIIVISARSEDTDKIDALDAGADYKTIFCGGAIGSPSCYPAENCNDGKRIFGRCSSLFQWTASD